MQRDVTRSAAVFYRPHQGPGPGRGHVEKVEENRFRKVNSPSRRTILAMERGRLPADRCKMGGLPALDVP
jgi:hypothetical protein